MSSFHVTIIPPRMNPIYITGPTFCSDRAGVKTGGVGSVSVGRYDGQVTEALKGHGTNT